MPQNKITIIIIFLAALCSCQAFAVDILTGQDVSISTGGMFGTVKSPEVNRGDAVPFGGAVIGAAFLSDFSGSYTGFIEPQVAVDAASQSVLKKGVNIGLYWHVTGGARRLSSKLPGIIIEEENTSSLSLFIRSGYFSFSARPTIRGAKSLEGAVVENGLGTEYRHDIFTHSSLGLRLFKSLLVFPTSVENLKTDFVEFSLFWRKII